MTGKPLSDVLALPGAEFMAWERHLVRNPPGTKRVETLLANLCAMFATAHGGKGARVYMPTDFAPWLKPPKRVREAQERKAMRANARRGLLDGMRR